MKGTIRAGFVGLSLCLGLSLGCAGAANAALTRVNLTTTLDGVAISDSGPSVSSGPSSQYPAKYAIDGNPRTRWDAGITASLDSPCWITVNLGDIYEISRVILRGATPGQRKNYSVSLSTDDVKWTPILPKFLAQGAKAEPYTAQYIQYKVFGGNSRKTARRGEMKILGDPNSQQRQVPIPAAVWLLGSGMALLGTLRRFSLLKSA